MVRPSTKKELLQATAAKYGELCLFIESLTEKELTIVFNFSADGKKKGAHWQRGKNLRDILIHLYEWQMFLINWVSANQEGKKRTFLPEAYNWWTYGQMNMLFWEKHQETPLEEAKKLLKKTHRKVLKLVQQFLDKDLFEKGIFDCTGKTTLGSYFVGAGPSHYDWAIKKLVESTS